MRSGGKTLCEMRYLQGPVVLTDDMLLAVGKEDGKGTIYTVTIGELRAYLEKGKQ